VKNVDSPRGLVWDHDRLYLIHPPDVSVYIDKKGEGVASEEHTLIKGIAFGFADRPADHTTNGLSIGVDGWLYIAGATLDSWTRSARMAPSPAPGRRSDPLSPRRLGAGACEPRHAQYSRSRGSAR